MLPFLAIGGIVGFFAGFLLDQSNIAKVTEFFPFLEAFSWIYLILSAPLWWFGMIFLHELGHFIAGYLSGFNFFFLSVGPIKIEKKQTGLKLSRHRHVNVAGGLTLMIPQNEYRNRMKWIAFISSGPLTSLLIAILVFIYLFSFYPGDLNSFWVTFLIGLSLSSFIMGFLLSAIPAKLSGLGGNDGYMLLDLLKGGNSVKLRTLLFKLINTSVQGTRPSKMSRSDIASLIHYSKNLDILYQLSGHMFAHSHYIDRGLIKKARFHLTMAEKLSETTDGMLMRPTVLLEKAWITLLVHKNIVEAEELLSIAEKGYHQTQTKHRVKSAVCLLNGDLNGARKEAELGISEATMDIDIGSNTFEIELLTKIAKGELPEFQS
jgi:hypothetical protein